eukprot:4433280-Prorocentrum_lima.AAC.1
MQELDSISFPVRAKKCLHQDPDCWVHTPSEAVESQRLHSTTTCWMAYMHWPDWVMQCMGSNTPVYRSQCLTA